MSNVVLSVICTILEFIILLFVVLSVGLDVLRIKKKYNICAFSNLFLLQTVDLSGTDCPRVCYSDWGVKRCGPHKPNPAKLPNKGFPGKFVMRLANCAAAFGIISVVVTFVSFILSILMICKCMPATVVLVLDIVAVITIIIAIGCLLGIYYKDVRSVLAELLGTAGVELVSGLFPELFKGGKTKIKQAFELYAAVGLVVCGWCLQVIVLILMIINACCC